MPPRRLAQRATPPPRRISVASPDRIRARQPATFGLSLGISASHALSSWSGMRWALAIRPERLVHLVGLAHVEHVHLRK